MPDVTLKYLFPNNHILHDKENWHAAVIHTDINLLVDKTISVVPKSISESLEPGLLAQACSSSREGTWGRRMWSPRQSQVIEWAEGPLEQLAEALSQNELSSVENVSKRLFLNGIWWRAKKQDT